MSVCELITVDEVIRRALDAKNIHDEQHLYRLTAVPVIGSGLSTGVLRNTLYLAVLPAQHE